MSAVSVNDIDFRDLEERYAVDESLNTDEYVICDGLPIVPASKISKLVKVIAKVFSSVAAIDDVENTFEMPMDPVTSKTLGFAFIRFRNATDAQNAIKAFNRKKLDSKHVMQLDKLSTVKKYLDTKETEYKEPALPEFKPLPHLKSWLTDELGRDQAAVHYEQEVTVQWIRKGSAPQPALAPVTNFTSGFVRWSPQGSYLLSTSPRGVLLHAGPDFAVVARFPHKDVKLVDFSPDERFLVTCAPAEIRAGGPFTEQNEGHNIVIWSTETTNVLRSFPFPPTKPVNGPPQWPAFKWSADSSYFARVFSKDELCIYSSKDMSLVGKKSMQTPGIGNFEFAPVTVGGKQLLVFWTPEFNNQTARVCIVDASTKEIVHNRSLFNVESVKFFWQSEGKYLCSLIGRLTKNKKAMISSLEIYRLEEKNFPIEVLDFTDRIFDFAWEPRSDRFVVNFYTLPVPSPEARNGAELSLSSRKYALSFYALERVKKLQGTWKETNRFVDRPASRLVWSPRGRFLATVSMSNVGLQVEFWDVDYEAAVTPAANSALPAAEDLPINVFLLASREHSSAREFSWDPSGRYFLTYSSTRDGTQGTKSYILWDHVGRQLRQEKFNGLMAFLWRPRPPSPLTKEQRRAASKKVKQLVEQFDMQDAAMAANDSDDLLRFIEATMESWRLYRKDAKQKLRECGIVPEEERYEVRDGTVYVRRDVVVEETEEVVD